MDIKFANWIKNALENAGEECEIRETYSGRGMFGRDTAGIVVNDVMAILPILINEAYNNGFADAGYDEEESYDYDFLTEFPNLRQDSMGKDIIIY